MQKLILRHGDCVDVLKGYEDASIGAFVCDPPYHISFMGASWDAGEAGIAFSARLWDEVYRTLRPGGVVKAFSGTRTFHRMAAAMAEAGFVDMSVSCWVYGSGFPKSMNIGKALGKQGGHSCVSGTEAQLWDGWGTALKPAWEPVVIGRKPDA